MAEGDCCMRAHANAKPPWSCPCPCHRKKEEETVTKMYIGDSVYAESDGQGNIILTTENSGTPSNVIFLEPNVIDAFLAFVCKILGTSYVEDVVKRL